MKKKRSLFTFSLYLFAITIIIAIIFIYYFYKHLGSGLIKCAEDEVNHLTSLIMNNCVHRYLEENNDLQLLKIQRNNNNQIERIEYNTKILNQTKAKIIDMLETDLDHMSEGNIEKINMNLNKLSTEYYEKTNNGIIFMVSVASSTRNPFFANLGPKIPLNLTTLGDTSADITTNITEYGLNNALLEISIELTITTIIHMPFTSKEVINKNKIPLAIEIIQGIVPNYYLNNNQE